MALEAEGAAAAAVTVVVAAGARLLLDAGEAGEFAGGVAAGAPAGDAAFASGAFKIEAGGEA